jgi:predicted anti-sigma-YlaC factor YlaD
MGKPWFRVKRYGFGAGLPCRWEGWALLAGFLVVIVTSGVAFAGRDPMLHLGLVLAATAIVVVVSWRKSDGPWKWRWGEG